MQTAGGPGKLPGCTNGKEPCLPVQETQEMWVQFLSQEDPLEQEMATLSSILEWKIPWSEEPGGLQSVESHRVDMTEQLNVSILLLGKALG